MDVACLFFFLISDPCTYAWSDFYQHFLKGKIWGCYEMQVDAGNKEKK